MSVYDPDPDGWPPERPTRIDTRVIGSVHGAYHAAMYRLRLALSPHGLDAPEALALAVMLRDPRCAPLDVRRQLGFHRSTLSSLLDRLETDGYIERPRRSHDGRRFELELTSLGKIYADISDLVVRDVEEEIATYTSREERRGALAVFEACVAIGMPGRPLVR
jgi:DNA-binding MarR family transcriptional regulator